MYFSNIATRDRRRFWIAWPATTQYLVSIKLLIQLRKMFLPVAVGRNKVETAVDAVVHNRFTMQSTFVLEIFLELDVDVVRYCLARFFRIQRIAKALFLMRKLIIEKLTFSFN